MKAYLQKWFQSVPHMPGGTGGWGDRVPTAPLYISHLLNLASFDERFLALKYWKTAIEDAREFPIFFENQKNKI